MNWEIFSALHRRFAAPLARQVGDSAYVPLRDGLMNPLNDTFDIHITLAQHLNHQHGEDHGWQSNRPHHQQQTQP